MNHAAVNRRQFLHRALGATTAAVAGPALAACAPGAVDRASQDGSGGDRTTITVMSEDTAVTKKVIADFEKANPDIAVSYLEYDYSRLSAMIAGNKPPDVVRALGISAPYFIARDLAEPLDDYLAKSSALRPDDFASVADLWRYDGKEQGKGPRYGLVQDYSQDAMHWLNLDVYEKAGIDPLPADRPASYDEILDLAKRLTVRTGGRTRTYGLGGYNDIGINFVHQQVASQGGTLFAPDYASVDFSSPEARKSLSWWLDLMTAQVCHNPANPAPDAWDAPVYIAGRIATFQSGYWFQGQLAATPKLLNNSLLVPAPTMGPQRVSPCFAAVSHFISRGSRNKEAAWRFLEFFSSGSPAEERAGSGWGLPALKSLEGRMPRKTAQQKEIYATQQREGEHFSILPFTPYVQFDAFENVMKKKTKEAVAAKASAGKLADSLNSALNELLAAEKKKVS